jgi:hypothetical protein
MSNTIEPHNLAAIVELLERKGLCTKQDHFDIIADLGMKSPRAKMPEMAFPEPYLPSQTEVQIIDDLRAVLNQNALTSHQATNLLERLGRINEMWQRLAKGTMH